MDTAELFDVSDRVPHLMKMGVDRTAIKVESISTCITTKGVGTRDKIWKECVCGVKTWELTTNSQIPRFNLSIRSFSCGQHPTDDLLCSCIFTNLNSSNSRLASRLLQTWTVMG